MKSPCTGTSHARRIGIQVKPDRLDQTKACILHHEAPHQTNPYFASK